MSHWTAAAGGGDLECFLMRTPLDCNVWSGTGLAVREIEIVGSSPISVGGKLLDDGITMRGSWKKSRSKNVR